MTISPLSGRLVLLAVLLGPMLPSPAGAQAPVGSAARTIEAPVIDGQLNESLWQAVRPMTGLIQTEPRILYDDKYIYVGVMCYDSDPSQVIVTDARRDSSLADADSFQMILDTYHDLQNGFIFGTNAAGVQYDAQVRSEGQNNAGGGGGGGAARTANTGMFVVYNDTEGFDGLGPINRAFIIKYSLQLDVLR